MRAGRLAEHLPSVAAAAAVGMVSPAKVAETGKRLTPARLAAAVDQGHDLAEVDAALALAAATQTHAKLTEVVARYAAGVDPDGPEPDPTEGRRLWLSKGDHCWDFGGRLDTGGGEELAAAIESIVQANRPQGDDRTRSQQNADALVQLCDNQLAAGDLPTLRTVKPQVFVTIDIEDLVDPDGLPLDVGRAHRVVPPHLRRAVEHRDGHCAFAGCGAPTHWCDVHHLVEWINDGATSMDNSALLCERHHTKVHHGFEVERDPLGRWRTRRPDGTEIRIGPPL